MARKNIDKLISILDEAINGTAENVSNIEETNETEKRHWVIIKSDISYKNNDSDEMILDNIKFDYEPDLDSSCYNDNSNYLSYYTLFITSKSKDELQAIKSILCGDVDADRLIGNVTIMGKNTRFLNSRSILESGIDYKKTIGFIQPDVILNQEQTVTECVESYLSGFGDDSSLDHNRFHDILCKLRMETKEHDKLCTLTEAERHKLLIARELSKGYFDLVILDFFSSPTTSLVQLEIYNYLKELDNYYGCVVVLSGSNELVDHLGGRVITIEKGKIKSDETVAIYDSKAVHARYVSVNEKNDYMLQNFRKVVYVNEDAPCPVCGCSKLEEKTETGKIKFGGEESNTPWFTSVSTILFCVCCGMRCEKKGSETKLEGLGEWLKNGIDGLDEKGKEEVRDLIKQIKERETDNEIND